MKRLTATIIGIIIVGTVITSCSSKDETVVNNAVEPSVEVQHNNSMQFSCMHFRNLLANNDVMTYAEQLKETEKTYTWAQSAYEDGVYQSGPLYHASRLIYSSAIDNFFTDEAMEAMGEVAIIRKDMPNP